MSRKEKKNVPVAIDEKIGAMRRLVQRFFLVSGLNRFLVWLFGIVAVDYWLDSSFRMDWSQRLITLLLGSAVLSYTLWKYLLAPLFSRISDDALLLQAEKSGKEFKESLISALEFSRMKIGEDENVSQGMVKKTIEMGERASDGISFDKVFRLARLRMHLVALVVLLITFAGLCAGSILTKPLGIWFNRNVMLGNEQWPQDYFLDVAGVKQGELQLPKGDDWVISAVVRKGYQSLPKKVELEFKSVSGRRTESMTASAKGDEFRVEIGNVLEPFEFRVISRESQTEWINVKLLNRPELRELSLVAVGPEYTGEERVDLPVGAGPYYLLNGTALHVEGSSDKPLKSALLSCGGERHELIVDGRKFSGVIPAVNVVSGTYDLQVEDREVVRLPGSEDFSGLGSRDPARFKIKLKHDRKPRVRVSFNGVSGMVVPGARLPFNGEVEDDYAVDSAEIIYTWKEDNSEREQSQGLLQLDGVADVIGGKHLPLDGAIEIAPLEIPVNSRLGIQFRATDNDTVTGPKSGESTKILLRVVGEAELRTDLLRREKEQRQVLSEMIKKQDLLLTDTGALAAECRELKVLEPSQRERVVALQKRQKLLGSNLTPIVSRLEGMLQEISNNRLEEEEGVLKARLKEKVIAPLSSLLDGALPAASVGLDSARRVAELERRNASFSSVENAQRNVIAVMREVLVHMVRNEGYQQAVNLLYEIQRAQERMRVMTKKAKEKSLKEVLRGNGAPEPKENPVEEDKDNTNR
ncbi:MAG: hypothetical protein GY899_03125 [Verrucomicrobiaceae bacterium]|nr:hypothetical protein [Verrucomicrobiaceae bacterium]